jgi:hypothetical protein
MNDKMSTSGIHNKVWNYNMMFGGIDGGRVDDDVDEDSVVSLSPSLILPLPWMVWRSMEVQQQGIAVMRDGYCILEEAFPL